MRSGEETDDGGSRRRRAGSSIITASLRARVWSEGVVSHSFHGEQGPRIARCRARGFRQGKQQRGACNALCPSRPLRFTSRPPARQRHTPAAHRLEEGILRPQSPLNCAHDTHVTISPSPPTNFPSSRGLSLQQPLTCRSLVNVMVVASSGRLRVLRVSVRESSHKGTEARRGRALGSALLTKRPLTCSMGDEQ